MEDCEGCDLWQSDSLSLDTFGLAIFQYVQSLAEKVKELEDGFADW